MAGTHWDSLDKKLCNYSICVPRASFVCELMKHHIKKMIFSILIRYWNPLPVITSCQFFFLGTIEVVCSYPVSSHKYIKKAIFHHWIWIMLVLHTYLFLKIENGLFQSKFACVLKKIKILWIANSPSN